MKFVIRNMILIDPGPTLGIQILPVKNGGGWSCFHGGRGSRLKLKLADMSKTHLLLYLGKTKEIYFI